MAAPERPATRAHLNSSDSGGITQIALEKEAFHLLWLPFLQTLSSLSPLCSLSLLIARGNIFSKRPAVQRCGYN